MKLRMAMKIALFMVPVVVHAEATDDKSSVLVTSVAVKRGTVAETITEYGIAEPAPGGATNISLFHGGQVLRLRVVPGQIVIKGDKLLDFGADPASGLAYNQAVSALALAKQEHAHTQQLLAQQLATRSQLAQAEKAVVDAEATLQAQQREGTGAAFETVTSPFDGTVTSIAVASGDRVAAAAPLLQLTRADGLAVAVGIEPAEHARVQTGATVHLMSLEGRGTAFDGKVTTVSGMLDPKTRLLDAFVSVPPGTVLPGEHFTAKVQIGELAGWLVPHQAVLSDEEGPYVFQIADGNKAARVAVHILGEAGDITVVDGPLAADRKLVMVGNYQLEDGASIREAAEDEPEDKQ
jgi:membrane fusion protein (multidrug efflux system)